MLWMRLARHYAVSKQLGPKLIMIQLMIVRDFTRFPCIRRRSPRSSVVLPGPQKDIFVFLALMFVVFAGYAVSLFAILHNDRSLDAATLSSLVLLQWDACRKQTVARLHAHRAGTGLDRRLSPTFRSTATCFWMRCGMRRPA
jgi:hypothetical protein